MLHNNLDPEVAERPDDLVVYGGNGRAARNWACFDAIVSSLRSMAPDDTLLVQSGKPVGVVRTHEMAPRVLIANSLLVPRWATPEHFRELEDAGLMMYGQMTAGSWIYIGTQGILQGTYATFAEVATQHFGGTLAGTVTLTGGLGGMGGAQPLAVTGNGGAALCVEVDPWRAQRRLDHGYLDEIADSLDDGHGPGRGGQAGAAGAVGGGGRQLRRRAARAGTPRLGARHRHRPDLGPRRAATATCPTGMTLEEATELRTAKPRSTSTRSRRDGRALPGDGRHAGAGAVVFDYGNGLRGQAQDAGFADAFSYPGFVVAYIRPLFARGAGPFRWACLSGSPADLAATDEAVLKAFPDDDPLQRWMRFAAEKVKGQGLPSRICWLGYGERHVAGQAFNELVALGSVSAPVVIGRDHLDAGSVASPERETEGMRDGSDAVADWPILNALLNTASGASWVSVHHGGGVGIGKSIHAGVVVVADGTDDGLRPGHPGAHQRPGHRRTASCRRGLRDRRAAAREVGIRVPMLDGTHARPGSPDSQLPWVRPPAASPHARRRDRGPPRGPNS